MSDTTYCRNCPTCDSVINYSKRNYYVAALKKNTVCMSCRNRITIQPLPDGIYESDGLYYRTCTNCGQAASYVSKYQAKYAIRDGAGCKACRPSIVGQKLKGRKITWGHNISGRPPKYIVSDPQTGLTANGKSEFARMLGIAIITVSNRIKKGIYTISEF